MTSLQWYDSTDPNNRRISLVLELSHSNGQRGTLYRTEREHPSHMWPAPHRIGSGYSRASAAKFAKREGLVLA